MNHTTTHYIARLTLCFTLLCATACSNTQHVKVTLPAAKINPQLASQLNAQASVLLQEDQPQKALALLKQAISANPQSARTYNNFGKIYYQQSQFNDALRMFRKSVALNAQVDNDTANPEPHNNLAMAYEQVGKHALAIKQYTQAHTLAPLDIQYTSTLAASLHDAG